MYNEFDFNSSTFYPRFSDTESALSDHSNGQADILGEFEGFRSFTEEIFSKFSESIMEQTKIHNEQNKVLLAKYTDELIKELVSLFGSYLKSTKKQTKSTSDDSRMKILPKSKEETILSQVDGATIRPVDIIVKCTTETKEEYEKPNSDKVFTSSIEPTSLWKFKMIKLSSSEYKYKEILLYNDVDSTPVSWDIKSISYCKLFFGGGLENTTLAAALRFYYFKVKKKIKIAMAHTLTLSYQNTFLLLRL